MKAELKFDCKECIDDITIDITIKGRTFPSFGEIRREAQKHGWLIGRDCYCPSCYASQPFHCKTCDLFEGNKSMGASICRLDGNFTTETDCCPHHKPMQGHKKAGYQNPVPVLD